jgi:hypothetical protein
MPPSIIARAVSPSIRRAGIPTWLHGHGHICLIAPDIDLADILASGAAGGSAIVRRYVLTVSTGQHA